MVDLDKLRMLSSFMVGKNKLCITTVQTMMRKYGQDEEGAKEIVFPFLKQIVSDNSNDAILCQQLIDLAGDRIDGVQKLELRYLIGA